MRRTPWLLAGIVGLACSGDGAPAASGSKAADGDPVAARPTAPVREAPALTVEFLRQQTRILSGDEMEGRRPGTPGARRATEHIVATMKQIGLEPAGDSGGWTQKVPMRSVRTVAEATRLSLASGKSGAGPLELRFADDIVVSSYGAAGEHAIDAPIVFAGYGVTAPEHEWDDYRSADVTGKVVVVFVGDPPVDDGRFSGAAMTYYGRWTYKFERALAAGAAGCLVVHETEPASYGWNVVQNSWSGERSQIVEPSGELPTALAVQGWISRDTADKLAARAGTTLAAWHERALAPGFAPSPTHVSLRGTLTTAERTLSDSNVIGRIAGASKPEEAVLISAHWDHLGTKSNPAPDEDAIFNGAVDNASGTAGLLGIGAALAARAKSGERAARSIVLLATTAEEQGLLGSKYYASHPLVPLAKIAGVVNIDSMNVYGKTRTIQVVGLGQSTLEDELAVIAKAQQRTIVPDERPGSGGYYRSDHFSFAKVGVPGIYFRGGKDLVQGGKESGERIAKRKARDYHSVRDEFDPKWSFAGALQDAQAAMELAVRVANADGMPAWKPGSEFAKVER